MKVTKNKIILSIFLIVLLYAILLIYSDIEIIIKIFQKIQIFYLFPILLIVITSVFLRSLLQRYLLKKIGIDISIKYSFHIFLSALSMVITPGGAGLLIKSDFIKRRYGHSISKTSPVVLTERFHDVLGDSLVIAFTIFFIFSNISFIITMVSTGIVVIIFSLIRSKKLPTLINFLCNKSKFFRKTVPNDKDFHLSLNTLFSNRIFAVTSICVVGFTLLDGVAIYLGFLALNLEIGFIEAVQTFYTSILSGALSFIPGGIGLTEASFIGILTNKGYDIAISTAVIIFIRLSTMWFLVAIGFVTSTFLLREKDYL